MVLVMGIQRKRQTATRSSPQSIRKTEESANTVHGCGQGKRSTQWEGALGQQSGGQDRILLFFFSLTIIII